MIKKKLFRAENLFVVKDKGGNMASNSIKKFEKSLLKGSLKKCGFEWWRLVTNAFSKVSGEERTFFFEFYIVNPALSPDKCLFNTKTLAQKTDEELFQALTEGQNIEEANDENPLKSPCFVMVKAGDFQNKGKQINAFFTPEILESGKGDFILKLGHDTKTSCMLGSDFTQGVVQVTRAKLKEMPVLDCNVGTIGWNMKFDHAIDFDESYQSRMTNYCVLGGKILCSGSIVFDGEEFVVNRDKSFAFYDKTWGKKFPEPYFHVSSNNFISQISGKKLLNSSLVIHGEFENKLSVLFCNEGEISEFKAQDSSKVELSYECFEVTDDPKNIKLHWTVSVSDKKQVLDIDVFSLTKNMLLRNYQCAEGKQKLLKILSSAEGIGEIRLYKKVKKNLELIEHARISNALCEYGGVEDAE